MANDFSRIDLLSKACRETFLGEIDSRAARRIGILETLYAERLTSDASLAPSPLMRIPSGLNDRNLYRDRARLRRESPQATRRIVRLVLALGVVLVVMRQAADPAIYKPFFPPSPTARPAVIPLTAPGAAVAPGDSSVSGETSRLGEPSGGATPDPTIPNGQTAPPPQRSKQTTPKQREAIAAMSLDERQTLTEELAAFRRRQEASPASAESLWQRIVQRHTALAMAFEEDSRETEAEPNRTNDLLAGLQMGLDAAYQTQVHDGAIWHSDDTLAFYRYLERATAADFSDGFLRSEPPPRHVGVLPLMQQPREYLGTNVWLYGNVARAIPVTAKANPFGIDQYWEVWIRPDDGTDRPVVFYTPDVPADVAAVAPDAALPKGPQVAIAGPFLKRRLFGSASGASEAPVIVGRIWERPAARPIIGTAPIDSQKLTLVVALAALIGCTIAGVLLWRSQVAARELRAVRNASTALPTGMVDPFSLLPSHSPNSRHGDPDEPTQPFPSQEQPHDA